jgi:hypothetical protein
LAEAAVPATGTETLTVLEKLVARVGAPGQLTHLKLAELELKDKETTAETVLDMQTRIVEQVVVALVVMDL